jgi:hypothetical protein
MNNFYAAVISILGLTAQSQNAAGVIWLICSMGVANASSGSYTGNPFTALKAAITAAGGRSMGYQDGAEQLLTSAEMRFASR